MAHGLQEKASQVISNKLERFVKEETKKHAWVEYLLDQIQREHPVLYKTVQPSELQITYFFKTNSKIIKERIE